MCVLLEVCTCNTSFFYPESKLFLEMKPRDRTTIFTQTNPTLSNCQGEFIFHM